MRPLCNKVAREPTSQSELEKSMDKTKKSENVFLNYFSLAHSQDSVVEYVSSVCRQIFPRIQVWGSRHNQNVFMSNICRFIRLGRHDCLSASYICGKMRTSDMAWLQTTAESCRLMPVTKQKILECFMEWIFTQIIIPLISASFYVTEGEGLGNEVLYYTKKDWRTVSAAGEAQMNQNFKLVSEICVQSIFTTVIFEVMFIDFAKCFIDKRKRARYTNTKSIISNEILQYNNEYIIIKCTGLLSLSQICTEIAISKGYYKSKSQI